MLPVILWQGWETLGEARERDEHDEDLTRPPLRLPDDGQQLVPAHRSYRTKLACTSSPTVTVVDSLMVGDLGMWLYRAYPGNP
jgi:hypothetical protein